MSADRPAVLVIGTGFANRAKRRVARMIASTLVESGLGLVCGNSTGVDAAVSAAYCAALKQRSASPVGSFQQISLGAWRFFRRGGWPLPGYAADPACRVPVADVEDWKRESIARCDAAVMVGGGRGSLDIARRIIDAGKPVFPLPFMGGLTGNSDFVFQDILCTWAEHPVPGVSRAQFLRLAEPWVSGTGALKNLLRGTLAQAPDVFVSYRRSDAPAAAGRIAAQLSEHFGQRRVFLDVQGIPPSRAWDESIEQALQHCSAGLVVIGRQWLAPAASAAPGSAPRLHLPGDVVRLEIEQLLARRKAIFPVLVEGMALPDAAALPEGVRDLLRFQAVALDNGNWDVTMAGLIREIDAVIQHADAAPRPPA